MTIPFNRDDAARLWPFEKNGLTFVNHGSFGAVANPIQDKLIGYTQDIANNPHLALVHQHGGLWFEKGFGLVEENRLYLAGKVNADPDGFVLVQGATVGVNAVLTSLETHKHFSAGDEILVTSHGYDACTAAARLVCERTGAKLVVAQIPFPLESEDEVVNAISASITPRTKLALIDHITSKSGLILPIEKIIPLCRQKGVPILVDGAHALGHVELDMAQLGADFYVSNGHKWLCAPVGSAFLYVDQKWRDTINPVVISHGANDTGTSLPPMVAKFNWQGTRNDAPWFCLKPAYEFLDGLHPEGMAGLMASNRALVRDGAKIIADVLQKPALPAPDKMIGQMVSFELDGTETAQVWNNLSSQGIGIQFVGGLKPNTRILRISAAPYNRIEDYQKLAKALPSALSL